MVVCFAIMVVIGLASGDEAGDRHYHTIHVTDAGTFPVDNLKFDHSIFSVEPPSKWVGFYFTDDLLVHYLHRTEQNCTIRIRQTPLKDPPLDENNARQIYLDEIGRMEPARYIRGERTAEQVTLPSSFPIMFTLGTTTNEAPTMMHTFFTHPPYLYSVELKVSDRLLGHLRADYYSVLRSIRIESRDTGTNSAPDTATITNSVTGSSEVAPAS